MICRIYLSLYCRFVGDFILQNNLLSVKITITRFQFNFLMQKLKLYLGLMLILFSFCHLYSQDDSLSVENKSVMPDQETAYQEKEGKSFEFSGYLKFLNATTFSDLDYLANDNLIHNRLNFKTYLTENLTIDLQIRNRILMGCFSQYPGL